MKKVMDLGIARHFRDEFRQAREVAYGNAENFQDLLFSLERLGITLTKGGVGLKSYKEKIRILAEESPLAKEIPRLHREWHVPFSDETEPCFADETIETVLGSFDGKPFLVIQKEKEDELLGILTAFDLL